MSFTKCERCPNYGGCAGRCAQVEGVDPTTKQRKPCPLVPERGKHCIRWEGHSEACHLTNDLVPPAPIMSGETIDLF